MPSSHLLLHGLVVAACLWPASSVIARDKHDRDKHHHDRPEQKPIVVPSARAPALIRTPTPNGGTTAEGGWHRGYQNSLTAKAQPVEARPRSWALDLVESEIAGAFSDVRHMQSEALAALLAASPERVVLLDVRTAEEFAMSRMPGVVHVHPDARSAGEVARQAGNFDGRIVVAYCAIGLRSSRLLVRIGQALKEKGASEVYNLSGGLFRWRNDGRMLVGPTGPTRAIHPYNPLWRQLLLDDPLP